VKEKDDICAWQTKSEDYYSENKRRSREYLLVKMTEGRHCQVHLLDDRRLELLVQPKLLSRELLDLVASHFNLKEKEYFGITFTDDIGQQNWLQLDHRVLDHDLPKKPGATILHFAVRFYIESISFLKDKTTVELFFLNAKSCVHKGQIEADSETIFKLAALVLQVRIDQLPLACAFLFVGFCELPATLKLSRVGRWLIDFLSQLVVRQ